MITAKTKKGTEVYVTFCKDVEPNKGGLYCQVYADENLDNDIDNFCISAIELQNDTSGNIARNIISQIDEY